MINGVVYPHYPVIDPTLPKDKVATLFIDTVTMSNMYLKGLGGDYDGDTISSKLMFTQEANAEAEDIMKSLKHFITVKGKLIRVVENEAFLTFYNMTKG